MPNSKPKKIGIDARFYGPTSKGLGRYTKEIIDYLTALDKKNKYIIFLRKENFADFQPSRPGIKKVKAEVRWYTLAEQVLMPYYIWRERIDLMHFPHFNVPFFCPAKFIVTIHDLILTKFPTKKATTLNPLFYKIKSLGYKLVIRRAIYKAKQVITVSQYTKNDIAGQFGLNPDKIKVTYEGISAKIKPAERDDKNIIFRYNIVKPYLLYVGNAYPHKNLEGLISVFANIKEKFSDLRLVLTGKEDYFFTRLKDFAKKSKFAKDIIFPGFIPDSDLGEVYKQALVYVFPSFFEGFGLPPLEAMKYGCAVASSNKTCLPEILGPAALYFNPEDKADMQRKIELIANDKNKRKELIRRGYGQIQKYSWEKCARQTLEIYKQYL